MASANQLHVDQVVEYLGSIEEMNGYLFRISSLSCCRECCPVIDTDTGQRVGVRLALEGFGISGTLRHVRPESVELPL